MGGCFSLSKVHGLIIFGRGPLAPPPWRLQELRAHHRGAERGVAEGLPAGAVAVRGAGGDHRGRHHEPLHLLDCGERRSAGGVGAYLTIPVNLDYFGIKIVVFMF